MTNVITLAVGHLTASETVTVELVETEQCSSTSSSSVGPGVLGNVDCSTGDLEPGQTERMSCLSDGQYTSKYDKVTAEADF